MMTTSSSLTAGWLAGIAFDVGFKRAASDDVGVGGGALLVATHDPTEPLGCGLAGGDAAFGCSCSLPYINDIGGFDVGGLGICVCAPDVGCCDFDCATCMLIALRNGTSAFSALSFAVNK